MRYHYESSHKILTMKVNNGEIVPFFSVLKCDHPVYDYATLFDDPETGKGLCVIRQIFDDYEKTTKWTTIETELVIDIFENPKFKAFFEKYAKQKDACGYYPTIPVRKLMWALRMKPLVKERWETTFDRMFV